MDFSKTLQTLLRARMGNIWIQTGDEYRAEALVLGAADRADRRVKCWRSTTGLFDFLTEVQMDTGAPVQRRTVPKLDFKTQIPLVALQSLIDTHAGTGPVLVIFEDVSEFLTNPILRRMFKEVGQRSRSASKEDLIQIVVIDSEPPVSGFFPLNLPPPTREEIIPIVASVAAMTDAEDLDTETIAEMLVGMTANQAQAILAYCLVGTGTLGVPAMTRLIKSMKSCLNR